MINKILKDIINKGKVTVFVNNVLVETKTEKEYNEIVKEMLKRLKENNLYVKPEKYMESKKDQIPRDCHRAQQNKNKKGKDRQSAKLARAKECKRCQKNFQALQITIEDLLKILLEQQGQ